MTAYRYEVGAVRWFKWRDAGDVRCHVPASGWSAEAMLLDRDPITNEPLGRSFWFMREQKVGDDE